MEQWYSGLTKTFRVRHTNWIYYNYDTFFTHCKSFLINYLWDARSMCSHKFEGEKKQLKHQQAPAHVRITIYREYVDAPPIAYSMVEL